ncbi:MAG TPA: PrsW family glutamic-type intramembrane protease [Dehalococcoidia bacterium]|nr:PrsW family glutamic-type intramembrane protease [Dehalococcoidia bacterium]
MERREPVAAPAPAGGPLLGHLLAVAVAVLGGLLGIAGAFVGEVRSANFLLLPFLGAPIIEEVFKPAGVYLLLIRWPHLLRGRLHTAALAALAGLAFGLVEAVVYITVYVSEPSGWFVVYRFSLPLVLHTTASFIVGLGINQGLLAWVRGGSPMPKASRNLYVAAIALHAAFNITATALAWSGVLNVD